MAVMLTFFLETVLCGLGIHRLRAMRHLHKYKSGVQLSDGQEQLLGRSVHTLADVYLHDFKSVDDRLCVWCRRKFTAHGLADGSGKEP